MHCQLCWTVVGHLWYFSIQKVSHCQLCWTVVGHLWYFSIQKVSPMPWFVRVGSYCEICRSKTSHLKAPLRDTIRPCGACRLYCTWANRKVWHVTLMYRTGENRVKRNYSMFYYRADSVAPAVRLPNQSAVNI